MSKGAGKIISETLDIPDSEKECERLNNRRIQTTAIARLISECKDMGAVTDDKELARRLDCLLERAHEIAEELREAR